MSYLLTNKIAKYCQIAIGIFCHSLLTLNTFSQSTLRVELEGVDSKYFLNKTFSSFSLADSALNSFHTSLMGDGYLLARLDTNQQVGVIQCKVNLGPRYTFEKSTFREQSLGPFELKYGKRKSLSAEAVAEEAKERLIFFENNGYPFASVVLDSLTNGKDSLHFIAHWSVNRGPLISLDDLIIKSEKALPNKYIINYLGLKKGKLYNESLLRGVSLKIKELAFIELAASPEVVFRNNKATVYLPLKRKKNNYFNGVIGLRPNETTGAVNVTGDVEIKLQNALNKAEDLHFMWKRLQPQTQDLFINTKIPIFVGLPLALDGTINIYRRDSTFSSVRLNGGIALALQGGNYIRFFFESNQTSRLGINTSQRFGDVNLRLFGMGYFYEKLDYKYNPRKGFSIAAEAATGNREVIENLETSNTLSREYYRLETKVAGYIPTWKRQTLALQATANRIFAENILVNEQYRIGGLRNLRGIDEESIFAEAWFLGTIEYRFLLDLNTALYAFYDHAWYSFKNDEQSLSDDPFGFGVGANFQTKAGIFTFNYALGNQFDNPILIRNAKISFGFRNIF